MVKTRTPVRRKNGVSDEAARARTGRGWDEWFTLLDEEACNGLSHRGIVSIVRRYLPDDGWWAQMVTVAYEKANHLREDHERPDDYRISRSKTIAAPISRAYAAFAEPELRQQWLDAELTPRTCTLDKSYRAVWADGRTTVEVLFYAKGAEKCQVARQHARLLTAQDAEQMKTLWGERLDALKGMLER